MEKLTYTQQDNVDDEELEQVAGGENPPCPYGELGIDIVLDQNGHLQIRS